METTSAISRHGTITRKPRDQDTIMGNLAAVVLFQYTRKEQTEGRGGLAAQRRKEAFKDL